MKNIDRVIGFKYITTRAFSGYKRDLTLREVKTEQSWRDDYTLFEEKGIKLPKIMK